LRDLRLEYDPRDLGRDVNGADDVNRTGIAGGQLT
jgi:hypothetical protein